MTQKKGYAMSQNNVAEHLQQENFYDPLTELLRNGARQLIAEAVEAVP